MGLQGLLKEFRGNYVIMRGHGRTSRVLSGPETWQVLRGPEGTWAELRGAGPALDTWRLAGPAGRRRGKWGGGDGGSLTQAHGAFLDHWSGKYSDEGFPSAFTAERLLLDAIREPWQRGFYGGRRRSGAAEFPDLQTEAGKRSEVERPYPGLLLFLVRTCGTSWTVLSY